MNIKVIIHEEGKQKRESIHPQESLPNFQRIFGKDLIDYYLVDDKGNKIEGKVTNDPAAKALEAIKERAQKLKIKGWHLMSEENLLKAIQKASQAETK